MASLLGSPSKTKSQNGVVKVKYNASKKPEAPTTVQIRQGRSQIKTSMVPPPQKSSLASQIMASRASSTPPSPVALASPATKQTPPKLTGFGHGRQFSDVQKKRLAEELAKNPEMTLYFKKKVASQLSKVIGLGEKQIISWFSTNQRKGNFDKPSSTPANTPVIIKKETPDSALANDLSNPKFPSSGDIECIDIDDDDDLLLNDSVLDESVTIEESKTVPKNPTSNEKAKHEQSSKDEIVHLLMDQIKELEKFVQTNSSPELEKFKTQMKEKALEIEKLRNNVKSKNENLQSMVRTSEDQEQRFAIEFKSLKEEIEKLKSNKRSTLTEDTNTMKVFKQRISELETMVRSKDEDYYILKNKLDLVENVANNKVKMYKEKLEETEKSKSSEDHELKKKYESLQKD